MCHNGLPRQLRICRRADFLACYERGSRHHTEHFLVFVLSGERSGMPTRTGMAVSRKVGNAVVRNRFKRLLREFYRLHREELPVESDVVAVVKKHTGSCKFDYALVCAELLPLFGRLTRRGYGRQKQGRRA
ncbi:MAG: ribonuclease P protein component [Desulfovibrio sp.]|nr:ribonuclease P protein component [Desulfovibrio sp.]